MSKKTKDIENKKLICKTLISNYIKCKGIKPCKAEIGKMNKNTLFNYKLSVEAHLRFKDTNKLKVKVGKRYTMQK